MDKKESLLSGRLFRVKKFKKLNTIRCIYLDNIKKLAYTNDCGKLLFI